MTHRCRPVIPKIYTTKSFVQDSKSPSDFKDPVAALVDNIKALVIHEPEAISAPTQPVKSEDTHTLDKRKWRPIGVDDVHIAESIEVSSHSRKSDEKGVIGSSMDGPPLENTQVNSRQVQVLETNILPANSEIPSRFEPSTQCALSTVDHNTGSKEGHDEVKSSDELSNSDPIEIPISLPAAVRRKMAVITHRRASDDKPTARSDT